MKPDCGCGEGCEPNTGCRSVGPYVWPLNESGTRWAFETFHTPACRANLEDPGASCECRRPFTGAKPGESK
jgi:hypothetical protein